MLRATMAVARCAASVGTLRSTGHSVMPTIHFTLNGTATEASYEPGMHLLEVLREDVKN